MQYILSHWFALSIFFTKMSHVTVLFIVILLDTLIPSRISYCTLLFFAGDYIIALCICEDTASCEIGKLSQPRLSNKKGFIGVFSWKSQVEIMSLGSQ